MVEVEKTLLLSRCKKKKKSRGSSDFTRLTAAINDLAS